MTAIDIHGSSWRLASAASALLPQPREREAPRESGERHGKKTTATSSINFGSTGPFQSPSASYGAGHTVHRKEDT